MLINLKKKQAKALYDVLWYVGAEPDSRGRFFYDLLDELGEELNIPYDRDPKDVVFTDEGIIFKSIV